MAKKKARKRSARRRKSLNGLPAFNASKINQNSVVDTILKPVGMGVVGAVAGHFAGKGKNLLLAAAGGAVAIATGYGRQAVPAIIGCAVVTPPASTATAGFDGIDGLKEYVSGGTNRAKGFVKSLLSNAGAQSLADKIPVSGIAGLGSVDDMQELYDQAYMNGVNDSNLLTEGGMDDMNGLEGTYMMAEGAPSPKSRSIAAAVANM